MSVSDVVAIIIIGTEGEEGKCSGEAVDGNVEVMGFLRVAFYNPKKIIT